MNLTSQQIEAVLTGEPVKVTPPEIGATCILVRADVYDRLRHLLYDDSELTTEELMQNLARSAEENGWTEPDMDAYDRYGEEKP